MTIVTVPPLDAEDETAMYMENVKRGRVAKIRAVAIYRSRFIGAFMFLMNPRDEAATIVLSS